MNKKSQKMLIIEIGGSNYYGFTTSTKKGLY